MPTAFRDVRFQGQSGKHLLTLSFSGFRPRLCENSDVELARRKFVSITLNKKRTALAVTVERRKERKQFCAFSARARFHTAWVKTGKAQCEQMFSALPLKADITLRTRYVRFVPITEVVVHAETGHAPSHGRASFAMCSTRCSASSPTPCKNADFNLWSQGRPRK